MSTSRRLDLKYRPLRFADVLGNDGVKRVLLARSVAGTLADQSMMFGGPKGCGKTTLARIVARAMKCSDLRAGEPCGECTHCVSILDETNRDVEELDAASQGTVDKVRDMVSDADFGSFDGSDLQVYVVDEAQRLSKAAQDAFLKAVESRLFIVVLCTTEPDKIQGPIRDRLEEYGVRPPSADVMLSHLRSVCSAESIEADDAALSLIVESCGRTPRTCLRTLESVSVLGRVTESSVRDYGRFDSYRLVDRVLASLDSDVPSSLSLIDDLCSSEGPTWIRDALVSAIRGGFRDSRGLKSHYPVPTSFFPVRGGAWLDLASRLSSLDRPSVADIEVVLLSTSPASSVPGSGPLPALPQPPPVPPTPVASPQPSQPPVLPPLSLPLPSAPPSSSTSPPPSPSAAGREPVKDLAPALAGPPDSASKSIEVDGVRFTDTESLTSLDYRVLGSSDAVQQVDRSVLPVELVPERVPITDTEFSASFLRRFQGRD